MDLSTIVTSTQGFSSSDLTSLAREASLIPLRGQNFNCFSIVKKKKKKKNIIYLFAFQKRGSEQRDGKGREGTISFNLSVIPLEIFGNLVTLIKHSFLSGFIMM